MMLDVCESTIPDYLIEVGILVSSRFNCAYLSAYVLRQY